MNRYLLIIKGESPATVQFSLARRLDHQPVGVEVTSIKPTSDPHQWVVELRSMGDIFTRLVRWFAEDLGKQLPLPYGSLLYYRTLREEVAA